MNTGTRDILEALGGELADTKVVLEASQAKALYAELFRLRRLEQEVETQTARRRIAAHRSTELCSLCNGIRDEQWKGPEREAIGRERERILKIISDVVGPAGVVGTTGIGAGELIQRLTERINKQLPYGLRE